MLCILNCSFFWHRPVLFALNNKKILRKSKLLPEVFCQLSRSNLCQRYLIFEVLHIMNIIELEINNICECTHAVLKFPSNVNKSPLYLVHSNEKCEIITLALQLICGIKYNSSPALHEIRSKIFNGRVKLTFSLLQKKLERTAKEEDHSSDSDVPCTSRQALQRLQRRLERRQHIKKEKNMLTVNACRDFTVNPDLIVYSINGGPTMECSVILFQIRFFTCTDIIFPRLYDITHGEYCNGRWLDLISTEFIDKGKSGENPIQKFCQLYASRKFSSSHILNEFTSSILTGRMLLNTCRISHLIKIFDDIRWLFEYITCSEFTVWFLLPNVFGNFSDISEITAENTNFDLMKTQIQLKNSNSTAFPWIQAEKHIQELLLVAVQLAFGYHCQQDIIYLHSLNYLEKHQSYEYLNYSLIQSSSSRQLIFEKDYFNRIFYVCSQLSICCVLEYCGGLYSYPKQGFVINCSWRDTSRKWHINVKDNLYTTATNSEITHNFLQQLEQNLK